VGRAAACPLRHVVHRPSDVAEDPVEPWQSAWTAGGCCGPARTQAPPHVRQEVIGDGGSEGGDPPVPEEFRVGARLGGPVLGEAGRGGGRWRRAPWRRAGPAPRGAGGDDRRRRQWRSSCSPPRRLGPPGPRPGRRALRSARACASAAGCAPSGSASRQRTTSTRRPIERPVGSAEGEGGPVPLGVAAGGLPLVPARAGQRGGEASAQIEQARRPSAAGPAPRGPARRGAQARERLAQRRVEVREGGRGATVGGPPGRLRAPVRVVQLEHARLVEDAGRAAAVGMERVALDLDRAALVAGHEQPRSAPSSSIEVA
jgi:hypothetical protein